MGKFKPIEQVRVADKIIAQLKEAILSGRFEPGDKLASERELMNEFQVSRVVIREAIRVLELTGFVSIRQGQTGGIFVNDLSFDYLGNAMMDLFLAKKVSAGELIQARLHLEPEIARLAATDPDPESLTRLSAAMEDECRPAGSNADRVTANLKVHYILAGMCGNRLYHAIASSMYHLTREIIMKVKPENLVFHEHDEHAEIVRAVLDADPNAAATAMHRHLSHMGLGLVELEMLYRKRMGLK